MSMHNGQLRIIIKTPFLCHASSFAVLLRMISQYSIRTRSQLWKLNLMDFLISATLSNAPTTAIDHNRTPYPNNNVQRGKTPSKK